MKLITKSIIEDVQLDGLNMWWLLNVVMVYERYGGWWWVEVGWIDHEQRKERVGWWL